MPPKMKTSRRTATPSPGDGVVVAPLNLAPSKEKPKPGGPPAKASPYMGIYLDDEAREKLRLLETETGLSGSAVIRQLIKNADGSRMARLSVLVAEMKSLL
jgi:hypothetical protein